MLVFEGVFGLDTCLDPLAYPTLTPFSVQHCALTGIAWMAVCTVVVLLSVK